MPSNDLSGCGSDSFTFHLKNKPRLRFNRNMCFTRNLRPFRLKIEYEMYKMW